MAPAVSLAMVVMALVTVFFALAIVPATLAIGRR